jgi:hypothetical protein
MLMLMELIAVEQLQAPEALQGQVALPVEARLVAVNEYSGWHEPEFALVALVLVAAGQRSPCSAALVAPASPPSQPSSEYALRSGTYRTSYRVTSERVKLETSLNW